MIDPGKPLGRSIGFDPFRKKRSDTQGEERNQNLQTLFCRLTKTPLVLITALTVANIGGSTLIHGLFHQFGALVEKQESAYRLHLLRIVIPHG